MLPASLGDVSKLNPKKPVGLALSLVVLTGAFAVLAGEGFQSPVMVSAESDALTPFEIGMLDQISGSTAWAYDIALEEISVSHFAFRSAGSSGANESAVWIKEKFEDFGLEAWTEPFEFTTWDLLGKPELVVRVDGNDTSDGGWVDLDSFQSEHFSWPTPDGGCSADAVVLPLPAASSRGSIGYSPIDEKAWDDLSTRGKIVFVGREVRWNGDWEKKFFQKMVAETPAALVLIWWYDWMNGIPPAFYPSTGGRPLGTMANYYWSLSIPTGSVNFTESMWIKSMIHERSASAYVSIPSTIASGTHYNVVGRLSGQEISDEMIIVSGHYDTVMDAGFCDNGAGVAGLLELANVTAGAVRNGLYAPRHSLLYVAFAAEELGMVGSVNFVKAHMAEMQNFVAVLNLDCIGSDELRISMTESSDGLDLDEVVLKAAEDLSVSASQEGTGGSDQESFRDPAGSDGVCYHNWGVRIGISGSHSVAASAMLTSSPVSYSDIWTLGTPGWIHTSYDRSSSTPALNWVNEQNMEDHMKVSLLSLLRLSPDSRANGSNDSGIACVIAGAVFVLAVTATAAIIYFKKGK